MCFSNRRLHPQIQMTSVGCTDRLISFQSLESTLDSWRLGIDYFFNRLPALHDTTPLIDREIRKTNRLYLYIAVFLRFHNHRH